MEGECRGIEQLPGTTMCEKERWLCGTHSNTDCFVRKFGDKQFVDQEKFGPPQFNRLEASLKLYLHPCWKSVRFGLKGETSHEAGWLTSFSYEEATDVIEGTAVVDIGSVSCEILVQLAQDI